jgi:tetratricopeptide (TPR) repeat protein
MRTRAAATPNAATRRILAGTVLGLATLIAYRGSFSVPFFFDDLGAIVNNHSIRDLSRIGEVLWPPAGGTGMAGRPVVNLSLALNYAVGGLNPHGYHALNFLLHLASALALFGLVRRTLLLPALRVRFGDVAFSLALATATLWALHPLQTESVTCVIQRTELLVGAFYLLTLYAFVRSLEPTAPPRWRVVSVAACAFGMASKEVMVSAPLLVLLYDRTFVAGTFAAAWRQRRRHHLALAATWLILIALLIAMGGSRGTAAGLGLGVPWWSYALTQCVAIPTYLGLSLWPHPLVIDYGTELVTALPRVLPGALLVLTLAGLTFAALRWRPRIGFLAFWFFAILAPSSSVVPLITQTIAEHRMYLPLAAVIIGAVLALHRVLGAQLPLAVTGLALGLAVTSAARNQQLQDDLTIWADTMAKRPGNARAYGNYALALSQRGRPADALPWFRRALALDPTSASTETNLGATYFEVGDFRQAEQHLRAALALDPKLVDAHANLGATLLEIGDRAGALASDLAALALDPNHVPAHRNAGRALFALGRFREAVTHYADALKAQPDSADAHYNLGLALARSGDLPGALPHFAEALRRKPDPMGYLAYARFLATSGLLTPALANVDAALQIKPDFPEAKAERDRLRAQLGTSGAPAPR